MPKASGADVKGFVKDWAGRGDEQKDSTTFWTDLFSRCFGITPAEITAGYAKFEHPVKGMTPSGKVNTRRADVLIPDHRVLIEQKSLGVDLDRQRDNGVWGRETPFQQARWYANNLPFTLRPRWIVTCNFETFRIYDLDQDVPELKYVEVALSDLPRQLGLLQFMHSDSTSKLVQERALSVEAGSRVARLYDALAACYHHIDTSADEQRSLNILITRLVFLLYAEDADLLQTRTAFGDYCQGNPSSLRERLVRLFETVDTPYDQRDEYLDPRAAEFPYIDGGLFEERHVIVPQLTADVAAAIAEVSREFDWSGISPTIFGAVFESTLNPETRRAGGMHYTSVENIHKLIGPLFLDELTEELERAEALVTVKARERALNRLHDKIAGLRFLDPACGSGNFLTETYLQLRRIENRILEAKAGDGQTMLTTEGLVRVSLDQFYGIEINDFAVAVAKTALWISESQMLDETQALFPLIDLDFLPLTSNEHIVHGNALRMDWNNVLPASQCSYVMGNPPFVGQYGKTEEQVADARLVWGEDYDGNLDYVGCWYKKAADYINGTHVRCALVSTNSICQGLQVKPLWKHMLEQGIHIDFAYKTFVWNSQASDMAHVHVVIIGFSRENVIPKLLFDSDGVKEALNINPYLADSPDVIVAPRKNPLSDEPKISKGLQPTDGGNLIIKDRDTLDEILRSEPKIGRFIRRYVGSDEFINDKWRWCFWLKDVPPEEYAESAIINQRLKAVREMRLNSRKPSTKSWADRPELFTKGKLPTDSYVIIPSVSSERREYVPMGFLTPDTVPSNLAIIVPGASMYNFGVLQSHFHNAWMRAVAGRLESRYRYGGDTVYNTFPWPEPTDDQRHDIEVCAKSVLDARDIHLDDSLATLYDPDFMPADLRDAHRALDAAVEAAYGVDFCDDEEKIVAHLFRLYAEKTAE